ncbi:MAG: acetate kinase [Oscillospiraceae bacterium]|nr:acetate kinase [Oscillospiraceae bacterium]
MLVLVVNAGSSSLKYQLLDMTDESVLAKGNCDRIGIDGHISHKAKGLSVEEDVSFPTHTEAFAKLVEVLTTGDAKVIDDLSQIKAIGNRIVQGGDVFRETVIVTDEVIDKIDALAEIAPVHNHGAALALRACKSVMPDVPMTVVFDTAFHQTIPEKAYMFGLPYEDYEQYHVRKYGFHGTSHRFVSAAVADAMGRDVKDLKIVTCHLGNGSSISAVKNGQVIDTTMGFTPLDGLLMGTRCGAVDPSAITYVMEKRGLTPSQMAEYMNKKSGLLGISGVSSDNRDVSKAAAEGNKRAALANEMLKYQVKKYIGAFMAAMNGADAIVFTGGIGENDAPTREGACEDMENLGIKLDTELNKTIRGKLMKISAPDSKVEVWVVPTNEELLIARDTLALVTK